MLQQHRIFWFCKRRIWTLVGQAEGSLLAADQGCDKQGTSTRMLTAPLAKPRKS